MASYDVRCQHSLSYYHSQLLALLSGLTAGLTDKALSAAMNAQGLLSSTGSPWTQAAVSGALHKLRASQDKSSYLHHAMLQLCFDGVLTKAQVLPLLQPRNSPALRM